MDGVEVSVTTITLTPISRNTKLTACPFGELRKDVTQSQLFDPTQPPCFHSIAPSTFRQLERTLNTMTMNNRDIDLVWLVLLQNLHQYSLQKDFFRHASRTYLGRLSGDEEPTLATCNWVARRGVRNVGWMALISDQTD